MDRVKISDCL